MEATIPEAPDAELDFIGCLLHQRPDQIADTTANVDRTDISDRRLQLIFDATIRAAGQGHHGPVVVQHELQQTGQLDLRTLGDCCWLIAKCHTRDGAIDYLGKRVARIIVATSLRRAYETAGHALIHAVDQWTDQELIEAHEHALDRVRATADRLSRFAAHKWDTPALDAA